MFTLTSDEIIHLQQAVYMGLHAIESQQVVGAKSLDKQDLSSVSNALMGAHDLLEAKISQGALARCPIQLVKTDRDLFELTQTFVVYFHLDYTLMGKRTYTLQELQDMAHVFAVQEYPLWVSYAEFGDMHVVTYDDIMNTLYAWPTPEGWVNEPYDAIGDFPHWESLDQD